MTSTTENPQMQFKAGPCDRYKESENPLQIAL